jgi:hypothetical protein
MPKRKNQEHDSLPEHELDEQWLLQHYGLAVHLHAHLTSIMESVDRQRRESRNAEQEKTV